MQLKAGGRNNPSGWPERRGLKEIEGEEFLLLLGSIHHRHLADFFGDEGAWLSRLKAEMPIH